MKTTVAEPTGPLAIFDFIASFLEKCQLKQAAAAIKAQRLDALPTPEGGFARCLRELVDAGASLLAELEATPGMLAKRAAEADPQEKALEQLVDGLLRKLMVEGHALSDETLSASIDNVISSEAFLKCAPTSGKPAGDYSDLFSAEGADVQKYWKQVQRESAEGAGAVPGPTQATSNAYPASDGGGEQLSLPDAGVPVEAVADEVFAAGVPGGVPGEVAQDSLLPAPVPVADAAPAVTAAPRPSEHYTPKPPRGSSPRPEHELRDWDHGDEYHDDDDPGYRIREIYETELLAELSNKTQPVPSSSGGANRVAPGGVEDELAACTTAEGEDELERSAPSPGAAPLLVQGSASAAPSPEALPAGSERSSSPTFGAPAGKDEDVAANGEGGAQEQRIEKKPAKPRKHAKYAASGDPFYPVELDGVIYDSFNLRVVFQRDKTGFEESKELPIRMNTVVAARYQILEYLGSAAFSRAVQCLDLENNRMVCMKIIKNDKDFFDQSLDEIKLLKYINVNGDADENNVLRVYDYFYHKEHLIIVTELLRDNLYEFSKFNRECGDEPYFTLGRLQKITKQVLMALDYVHGLRLIHCDLKPENILIKSYSRCEVKVIDFGSSCFVDDHLSSYVQSRSYRAPEIMLGLPYDQKIDIWSLGCIIAELWTGFVLFQNDSVQSLLARILGIIGDFPYHLMTKGKYVPQYFTQDGQLYQEIEAPACPERGRRLHLLVPKKTSLYQRMRTDSAEFLDFLTQMLQVDPAKRPTAAEAMEHPWLKVQYPDGLVHES